MRVAPVNVDPIDPITVVGLAMQSGAAVPVSVRRLVSQFEPDLPGLYCETGPTVRDGVAVTSWGRLVTVQATLVWGGLLGHD